MNMQTQWGCDDGSVWPHNGEICNSLESLQLLLRDNNRFEFCSHALGAFSIMLCAFNLLWSYCVACVPLIDAVREAVFGVPHGGSENFSCSCFIHFHCCSSDLLGVKMYMRKRDSFSYWFLTHMKYSPCKAELFCCS